MSAEAVSSDLQEQFERIDIDTYGRDRCYAPITEINRHRDEIRVGVELPSGRVHHERFEYPEVASNRYEFVRLLDSLGHGLITVGGAIGSEVSVRFDDDGPHIEIPDPPRRERMMATMREQADLLKWPLTFGILLTWPVSGLVVFPKYHQKRWGWKADTGEWLMEYLLAGYLFCSAAWIFLLLLFAALLEVIL